MDAQDTSAPTRRRRRSARLMAILAGLLAAAVVLGLLATRRSAAVAAGAYDYIQAKADDLHDDPSAVEAYVRDQVAPTATYEGELRGPVGTLWAGSGSDLDRSLLLQALLADSHTPSRLVRANGAWGVEALELGGSWAYAGPSVTPFAGAVPVDIVPEPDVDSVEVSVVTYPSGGGDPVTSTASYHVADLAAHDLVVSYALHGDRILTAVDGPGGRTLAQGDAATARRQELTFRFSGPGAPDSVVTRELFTRELADFPSYFSADNRYSIAVTAGWVPEDALTHEREAAAAQSDTWLGADHAALYTFLTRSDANARTLAGDQHVTAGFIAPRITIVGTETRSSNGQTSRAMSIDLRKNDVAVDGAPDAVVAFGTARSMYDASLESQVLTQVSGAQATSAADLLADSAQQRTDTLAQRQAVLAQRLPQLLDHGAAGTSLTVAAPGQTGIAVTFAVTDAGLRMSASDTVRASLSADLDDAWLGSSPLLASGDLDRAARETEVALANAGHLPVNYAAVYTFTPSQRWYDGAYVFSGTGEATAIESVSPDVVIGADLVTTTTGAPSGGGTLTVRKADLDGATDIELNPRFVFADAGSDGWTFEMLSRRSYAELLSTGSTVVRFSSQIEGFTTDPIRLWVVGHGTQTVTVNGGSRTVPVLQLNGSYEKSGLPRPSSQDGPVIGKHGVPYGQPAGDIPVNKLTVLADPDYPWMMGFVGGCLPGTCQPQTVQTGLPGVVTDAVSGQGVDRATVTVGRASTTTWPDGGFSTAASGQAPGPVQVTVTAAGYQDLVTTVDLSAAGALPLRLRLTPTADSHGMVWLSQENVAAVLPGLGLSDRASGLIKDALAADDALAVGVPRFAVRSAFGHEEAWVEMNTRTSEIYPRMDDGLYGATSLSGLLTPPDPSTGPNLAISYFGGRVAAWYLFSAGALDFVSAAMNNPSLTLTDMYRIAVNTACILAQVYIGPIGASDVVSLFPGASTPSGLVYNALGNAATRKGVKDGLKWLFQGYHDAWGVGGPVGSCPQG